MKTRKLILFENKKHLLYFLLMCYSLNVNTCFASLNCTEGCAGLDVTSESTNENVEDEESSELDRKLIELFNTSDFQFLRFATPCETPNHEPVFCVDISNCPVLKAVKNKAKYAAFVEASRCGPANEDKNDFKVCCGNYNSFRNVSKQIVVDSPEVSIGLSILPPNCGTQKQIMRGRIIGGTEATLGEYPWLVRLIHKNDYGKKSYGCAGFLIHRKFIITAAHCIESEFSAIRGPPYSVILGEHNTNTKIDCSPGGTYCADPPQVSKISSIVVHPKYSNKSTHHHYDISLIQMKKAVKLTEYIQPICLLKDANQTIKKYYISGWGKTETADSSPVKLKIDLNPFDHQECTDKFGMLALQIDDTQICAGGTKMKDSCNGDSGGPLMISPNGKRFYAAGIVSYGVGCGHEGWPGVYTSIPAYYSWIEKELLKIENSQRSPKAKKNKKKKKHYKRSE